MDLWMNGLRDRVTHRPWLIPALSVSAPEDSISTHNNPGWTKKNTALGFSDSFLIDCTLFRLAPAATGVLDNLSESQRVSDNLQKAFAFPRACGHLRQVISLVF